MKSLTAFVNAPLVCAALALAVSCNRAYADGEGERCAHERRIHEGCQ
jgi:hypothetical protein